MSGEPIAAALMRALRHGLRETLTLASQLRLPVAQINQELTRWQAACPACLELSQPYPDEPRLVITVQDWTALQQLVADTAPAARYAEASRR
jgi:hypothetical protein